MYYLKFLIINLNVLLSNQIAGFFDYQLLWRETISVIDLLRRDICQRKIASKSTAVGLV